MVKVKKSADRREGYVGLAQVEKTKLPWLDHATTGFDAVPKSASTYAIATNDKQKEIETQSLVASEEPLPSLGRVLSSQTGHGSPASSSGMSRRRGDENPLHISMLDPDMKKPYLAEENSPKSPLSATFQAELELAAPHLVGRFKRIYERHIRHEHNIWSQITMKQRHRRDKSEDLRRKGLEEVFVESGRNAPRTISERARGEHDDKKSRKDDSTGPVAPDLLAVTGALPFRPPKNTRLPRLSIVHERKDSLQAARIVGSPEPGTGFSRLPKLPDRDKDRFDSLMSVQVDSSARKQGNAGIPYGRKAHADRLASSNGQHSGSSSPGLVSLDGVKREHQQRNREDRDRMQHYHAENEKWRWRQSVSPTSSSSVESSTRPHSGGLALNKTWHIAVDIRVMARLFPALTLSKSHVLSNEEIVQAKTHAIEAYKLAMEAAVPPLQGRCAFYIGIAEWLLGERIAAHLNNIPSNTSQGQRLSRAKTKADELALKWFAIARQARPCYKEGEAALGWLQLIALSSPTSSSFEGRPNSVDSSYTWDHEEHLSSALDRTGERIPDFESEYTNTDDEYCDPDPSFESPVGDNAAGSDRHGNDNDLALHEAAMQRSTDIYPFRQTWRMEFGQSTPPLGDVPSPGRQRTSDTSGSPVLHNHNSDHADGSAKPAHSLLASATSAPPEDQNTLRGSSLQKSTSCQGCKIQHLDNDLESDGGGRTNAIATPDKDQPWHATLDTAMSSPSERNTGLLTSGATPEPM